MMIYFDSATWNQMQEGIDDNPSERINRTREALDMLGRSLASGAQLPPESAQWLGVRLVEIAQAEWKLASDGSTLHRPQAKDANSVLGLRNPKGRQAGDSYLKLIQVAETLYLESLGHGQKEAANIVADLHKFEDSARIVQRCNEYRRKNPRLSVNVCCDEFMDVNYVYHKGQEVIHLSNCKGFPVCGFPTARIKAHALRLCPK